MDDIQVSYRSEARRYISRDRSFAACKKPWPKMELDFFGYCSVRRMQCRIHIWMNKKIKTNTNSAQKKERYGSTAPVDAPLLRLLAKCRVDPVVFFWFGARRKLLVHGLCTPSAKSSRKKFSQISSTVSSTTNHTTSQWRNQQL